MSPIVRSTVVADGLPLLVDPDLELGHRQVADLEAGPDLLDQLVATELAKVVADPRRGEVEGLRESPRGGGGLIDEHGRDLSGPVPSPQDPRGLVGPQVGFLASEADGLIGLDALADEDLAGLLELAEVVFEDLRGDREAVAEPALVEAWLLVEDLHDPATERVVGIG